MLNKSKLLGTASIFLISFGLAGCVSSEKAFEPVQDLTSPTLGFVPRQISTEEEIAEANRLTDEVLKKSLTMNDAVKIAILKDKALQASYNELGLARAALIKGSVPSNPVIAFDETRGPEKLETERMVFLNLFSVLTLPVRREIATEQLRAVQMRSAEATLSVALNARQQYLRTVAARERLTKLNDIKRLTDAGAELAKRLGESGGLNKLSQAREFTLAAELDSEIARAKLDEQVERERLVRTLGLWGDRAAIKLPEKLPALPSKIRSFADVEGEAIKKRVDLQAARHDLAALATSVGLTEVTRFVNDIDLVGGQITETSLDGQNKEQSKKLGVDIEIPIFDFGAARVLDTEQRYMRAANLLADKAINIRSEVREAYIAYQGMHQISRHFESRILPLRRIIEEESLLHYNGMLTDVSDLLADTKAGISAQIKAVNARRDFFIAENQLEAAMLGGSAGSNLDLSGGASAALAAEPAGH